MKRKYSILENLRYVLHGMRIYGKGLMPAQIFSIFIDGIELFLVPILVKLVIQAIEQGQDIALVLKMLGIYAGLIICIKVFQGLITIQTEWKMKYVLIRFKRELMNTMLSMDYANMENPKVLDEHEKIRNVMNNNDAGIEGMMNSSIRCGKLILQIAIAAVIISNLNIFLTVIISVILILAAIPIDKAKRDDKKQVWDALGPLWRKHFNLGFLTTRFNSAKDIRLYNMKDWIYSKYLGVNSDIQEKYVISRNIWHKSHLIVNGLGLVQEIALYSFLLYRVFTGNLSIADFTLYISSVHIFTKAFNEFMHEFADIKKQSLDVADFRRFVDEFTIADLDNTNTDTKNIKPDISFFNVSFCYQGQDKNALEDININIPYGQRLAVVGLNGAGKTTFIKLLCGLYEPDQGEILINNKNIRDINKHEKYELYSPVFQNVEEYPFSIAENISMKKMENTEMDKVNDCLKKCGLYEKIQTYKGKEETQLGKELDEDGVELSGGEKQKLALARALYKDSQIVILDEPTSALDPLAEERLYRSFDDLIGEKTGIYISHRLSSTRFCDKIAMFDNGRIIEYGTHEELMAIRGRYFEIYNSQAQYYKEGAVDEK